MKNIFKFITLTLALVGLLAILYFPTLISKHGLLTRKRVHQRVGEIVFVPLGPGEYVSKIDVMFKTGNEEVAEKISSFSFRLIYKGDFEQELKVISAEGIGENKITPDKILVSTGDWVVPVNRVVQAGKDYTIDFAAVYTGVKGFSTNEFLSIATIYLEEDSFKISDLEKLEVDKSLTAMYAKDSPAENVIKSFDTIVVHSE